MDKELWKVDRYSDFLKERRKLIAEAANNFLNSLLHGEIPEPTFVEDIMLRKAMAVPVKFITDEEEDLILECAIWMEEQGLPPAEIEYELCDETGNLLSVLDLAWPEGLQQGLSKPIALLMDGDRDVEQALNQKGYIYFTSVNGLKKYVQDEIINIKNSDFK